MNVDEIRAFAEALETELARLKLVLTRVESDRDAAIARAEKAEKERDALGARRPARAAVPGEAMNPKQPDPKPLSERIATTLADADGAMGFTLCAEVAALERELEEARKAMRGAASLLDDYLSAEDAPPPLLMEAKTLLKTARGKKGSGVAGSPQPAPAGVSSAPEPASPPVPADPMRRLVYRFMALPHHQRCQSLTETLGENVDPDNGDFMARVIAAGRLVELWNVVDKFHGNGSAGPNPFAKVAPETIVCGVCNAPFNPAELDQVLFHEGDHKPRAATGIVGVKQPTPPVQKEVPKAKDTLGRAINMALDHANNVTPIYGPTLLGVLREVRSEVVALHRERSAHLNLLSGMQNDVRNYLIVTRPDGAEAYSAIVMQAPGDMRPILRFWKDEVEALRKERDAMLKDHAELMEAAESGDRDRTRSAAERDVAIERAERAERFKVYVHQRLDEAGIPTNPGGAHSAKGCRIGDRLDLILAANAREAKLRTALKLWRAFPHTTVPHCGSCGEAGRRAAAMTDAALSGPATGAHGAQACQFCTVGHVKLKAEVVSVIELLEKVQDLLQKINEPCSASYGIQCSIAALRLAVIGDQK